MEDVLTKLLGRTNRFMRCVRARLTLCFYPLVRDQYNAFQPERSSRAAAYMKMYVPRDSKLREGFHTNRYSIDDSLIMRLTLFGVVSQGPGSYDSKSEGLINAYGARRSSRNWDLARRYKRISY